MKLTFFVVVGAVVLVLTLVAVPWVCPPPTPPSTELPEREPTGATGDALRHTAEERDSLQARLDALGRERQRLRERVIVRTRPTIDPDRYAPTSDSLTARYASRLYLSATADSTGR